jgi:hypothetical protein
MDLKNWCEYMRDVKETAHLTNAYIAKEADVSVSTIERIMAINIDKDIVRATARRIEQVVIGPVSKYFCDIDYDGSAATDRITSLLAEIERLEKENARKYCDGRFLLIRQNNCTVQQRHLEIEIKA